MRPVADAARVERFIEALSRSVRAPTRVYLTGGATAVLEGWRETTVDIDLKLIPDSDELLRAIPRLKEEIGINVELAAPDQFIPEVPGWRERSRFIKQARQLSFYHYDHYSQALAKLERGHEKDLLDVKSMLRAGRIELSELQRLFEEIEPMLFRYPAIDPKSFRSSVEQFTSSEP
ncbi:MAG: DUF6036 family nucleotidyltransferase [Acidobacteriota bacterium]